MSFVPPVFSDFGKKGKDLFSKKYNFGNSLVVKHKKAGKCNLVLESKANFGSCGVGGATKVTCENTDRKIEVTGSTCGTLSASVEQKNVAQGVTVKVCGGCDGPCGTSSCADKKACADQKDSKCSASSCLAALNGEARVEYRREYVAATAGLSTKKGNVSLCGSGVAGSNGVSVGGRFSVDLASQELKCYGVGAQYETSDCVVALTTAKLNSYSLSAYHTVDRDTTIGFQFDHNSKCNKSPRVLWAAIEHAAAPDTTVKAKASSAGCGALAVEHRVGNPNVQLGFSAGFNFANASGNLGQALSPDKFGVQLTLGDF